MISRNLKTSSKKHRGASKTVMNRSSETPSVLHSQQRMVNVVDRAFQFSSIQGATGRTAVAMKHVSDTMEKEGFRLVRSRTPSVTNVITIFTTNHSCALARTVPGEFFLTLDQSITDFGSAGRGSTHRRTSTSTIASLTSLSRCSMTYAMPSRTPTLSLKPMAITDSSLPL